MKKKVLAFVLAAAMAVSPAASAIGAEFSSGEETTVDPGTDDLFSAGEEGEPEEEIQPEDTQAAEDEFGTGEETEISGAGYYESMKPVSIRISKQPDKTVYWYGLEHDDWRIILEGLEIETTYDDGSKIGDINASSSNYIADECGNEYHMCIIGESGKNVISEDGLELSEDFKPGKYEVHIEYKDLKTDTITVEFKDPALAPEIQSDLSKPCTTQVKAENGVAVAKFVSQEDTKCVVTADGNDVKVYDSMLNQVGSIGTLKKGETYYLLTETKESSASFTVEYMSNITSVKLIQEPISKHTYEGVEGSNGIILRGGKIQITYENGTTEEIPIDYGVRTRFGEYLTSSVTKADGESVNEYYLQAGTYRVYYKIGSSPETVCVDNVEVKPLSEMPAIKGEGCTSAVADITWNGYAWVKFTTGSNSRYVLGSSSSDADSRIVVNRYRENEHMMLDEGRYRSGEIVQLQPDTTYYFSQWQEKNTPVTLSVKEQSTPQSIAITNLDQTKYWYKIDKSLRAGMVYKGLVFEVTYSDGQTEKINAKWNGEDNIQTDSFGNEYRVYLQTLDGRNLSYDENYEPGKYQYVVKYDDDGNTIVSDPCYIEIVHPKETPEIKQDVSKACVTEIKTENGQAVAKFTPAYDLKCTLSTDQDFNKEDYSESFHVYDSNLGEIGDFGGYKGEKLEQGKTYYLYAQTEQDTVKFQVEYFSEIVSAELKKEPTQKYFYEGTVRRDEFYMPGGEIEITYANRTKEVISTNPRNYYYVTKFGEKLNAYCDTGAETGTDYVEPGTYDVRYSISGYDKNIWIKDVEVKPVEEIPAINVKGKVTVEPAGVGTESWFQLRTGATGRCKIDCAGVDEQGLSICQYNPETRELRFEKGIYSGETCQLSPYSTYYISTAEHVNYTLTFSVTSEDEETAMIADCKIAMQSEYTYTGKEITPSLELIYKGTKLQENRDYIISYSGNKELGNGIITITGAGDYHGTIQKAFAIIMETPVLTVRQDGPSSVKLTWKSVLGADEYEVYRKDGENWKAIDSLSGEETTDTGLTNGTAYQYKIRAICWGPESKSHYSEVKSVTIGSVEPNPTEAPKPTTAPNPTEAPKPTTAPNPTTAPDPTATPAPAQSLKTPSISAAVLSGTTGVKLTWKKVTGAQKYYVYRSTDGKKWTKVKTTGSTTYTDTKLTKGRKYTYKLRAYSAATDPKYSSYSKTKSVLVPLVLSKPSLTVKKSGSKALKLTWKKVANAQKYVIYRYDKKKWVKVKTVSANTLSYTDKNKKKGTTYKYRIRAYSTKAAPDKYSAYSATKSVKR